MPGIGQDVVLRAISWYSFCVGQDIYRLFSIDHRNYSG